MTNDISFDDYCDDFLGTPAHTLSTTARAAEYKTYASRPQHTPAAPKLTKSARRTKLEGNGGKYWSKGTFERVYFDLNSGNSFVDLKTNVLYSTCRDCAVARKSVSDFAMNILGCKSVEFK